MADGMNAEEVEAVSMTAWSSFQSFWATAADITTAISMVGVVAGVLLLIQSRKSQRDDHKAQLEALRQDRDSQRRYFFSEHVMKFFTNEEFLDTFHYLVYTYSEGRFDDTKKKVKHLIERGMELFEKTHSLTEAVRLEDLFESEKAFKDLREEMFQLLTDMQDERGEGHRFYHPRLFHGSVEDRRLDALLGYFNTLAQQFYSVELKLLTLDDIREGIGYYIIVTVGRPVVADYIEFLEWLCTVNPRFNRLFGKNGPYSYLKRLFEDLTKKQTS